MRRGVALSLAGLAACAVVAGPAAGVASATPPGGYPPPCPVRPFVELKPDAVQVNIGCLAPITIPIPPITT